MSTINQTHVFPALKWSRRSSVQFISSRDDYNSGALNRVLTSFVTDIDTALSMGMFSTDCSGFETEEYISFN